MPKAKAKRQAWLAWSKDEVKLLKKLYPDGGAREIAERTGRPLTSVRRRAYYMGIQAREYRRWSANEVQLLKELYRDETAQSIADKLGRTLEAVRSKARTIGLKQWCVHPWSRHEIALLKRLYPDHNNRDIANELGRTVRAVARRARILGISEQRNVWSKRELNLLKRLYPSKTAKQIAERIGRPAQATRKKIVLLGLKKRFRYEECHRVVNGTKQKLCCRCKQWKKGSLFHINRRSKDGLNWQCKECAHKRYEQVRKTGRKYLRYEDRHRVVKGIRQKLCCKCKRWENETGFHKDSARKDGLNSRCKKCSYKAAGKSRKK